MICTVSNEIVIQDPEADFLKSLEHSLTFTNPEYVKKTRMGFWTGDTPKTLSLMWRRGNQIGIPFGCIKRIAENKSKFCNIVNRVSRPINKVDYDSSITLYDYQQEAVNAALKQKNGIITAPCGSGKTQMGLEIAARIGGKTLWLTHTMDLLNQSMDRAKSVLGLPDDAYGMITAGKVNVGSVITFATVQTMSKMDLNIVRDAFDVIIVDEAHHCVGIPSKVHMFYKVVSSLCARYKIGLTATPTRQDGLIGCMYALLGDDIYKVTNAQVKSNLCDVCIQFMDTGYSPNLDVVLSSDGTLQYTSLITDMTEDTMRNSKIVEHIKSVSGKGMILTDRVSHVATIARMLGNKAVTLTGRISKNDRERAISAIKNGEAQFLVATYSIAREGLDIPDLDNLFLVTPKKDYASVIQSVGRVARKADGKKYGYVYDYVDDFGMLRGWARKRSGFYKKAGYYVAF